MLRMLKDARLVTFIFLTISLFFAGFSAFSHGQPVLKEIPKPENPTLKETPKPIEGPTVQATQPNVTSQGEATQIPPGAPVPQPIPPGPSILTGKWRGNDGVIYFLRQDGLDIWWAGLKGSSITSIFKGTLPAGSLGGFKVIGFNIAGKWCMPVHPRGIISNCGYMYVKVNSLTQLQKVADLAYYNTIIKFPNTYWTNLP